MLGRVTGAKQTTEEKNGVIYEFKSEVKGAAISRTVSSAFSVDC
ncbi:hypothetical protein BH10ACI3_BH10ACI3_06940 [soil metagenome]